MPYKPEEIEELQYIGSTQSTSNVHRVRELDYNQKIIVSGTVPTERDPQGNIIIKSDTYEGDPSQMLGANLFQRNYDNSELKKAVDTEIRELDVPTTEDRIDRFFKLFNDVKDDLSRTELGIVSGSIENQLGIDLVNRKELEEAQSRIDALEQLINDRKNRIRNVGNTMSQIEAQVEQWMEEEQGKYDSINQLRNQIDGILNQIQSRLNSVLSNVEEASQQTLEDSNATSEAVQNHIRDRRAEDSPDPDAVHRRMLSRIQSAISFVTGSFGFATPVTGSDGGSINTQ